MDEIKNSITVLEQQCVQLDSLDLAAVQKLLDSIQECYLDLIGAEPKKSAQAAHKLWKVEFRRLNALVSKAEGRERELYDLKFPMVKYYGEQLEQATDTRELVRLKREIDAWLAASAPEIVDEFAAQGYQDLLDEYCEGLDLSEPEPAAAPAVDVYRYSPIPYFMRYLPLLYSADELWESFQLYIRNEFKDQDDNFFAFHREPDAMKIWQQVIENSGGGIPFSIFAAGAFLLMRYKELGHDLDKELQAL